MKISRNIPIKTKIVSLCFVFIILTAGLLCLNEFFHQKRNKLKDLESLISQIEMSANKMLYLQNEFLLEGTVDTAFFITGSSDLLVKRDELTSQIKAQVKQLFDNKFIFDIPSLNNRLDGMRSKLDQMSIYFKKIRETTLERGFKNYGLEGKMRHYAHKIEQQKDDYISDTDLLNLRRHEKDFILRKDDTYINLFDKRYNHIQAELDRLPRSGKTDNLKKAMTEYHHYFHRVADCEHVIGFKDGLGIRNDLEHVNSLFYELTKVLKTSVQDYSQKLMNSYDNYLVIILIIYFSGLIFLAFVMAEKLTRRLRYVSDSMTQFVNSDFKNTTLFAHDIGQDEIGFLAKNFQILEHEISVHFKSYRDNASKKQFEILRKNEVLQKANGVIEEQNRNMLDSINYAKRIQSSILPTSKRMNQLLSDHMLIFKPKDIVSGDFYWVDSRANLLFIAVVDCTGHGVPGAFMSLIGHNFLNQAINERDITAPGLILSFMNNAITQALEKNQHNDIIRDGLDIALAVVDRSNDTLTFAGAQRPLIIVRDEEMIDIKGHRLPVGGQISRNIRYPQKTLNLKDGDRLYMFSDGYVDQFGGPNSDKHGKKFKTSQLKNLIYSCSNEHFNAQQEILEEAFDLWKGSRDQIDDVCLLGWQYTKTNEPA